MPFPQMQGLPEGASITGLLDYDIHKVEWNKYELKEWSDGLLSRDAADIYNKQTQSKWDASLLYYME